jgi:hypothetical protein
MLSSNASVDSGFLLEGCEMVEISQENSQQAMAVLVHWCKFTKLERNVLQKDAESHEIVASAGQKGNKLMQGKV